MWRHISQGQNQDQAGQGLLCFTDDKHGNQDAKYGNYRCCQYEQVRFVRVRKEKRASRCTRIVGSREENIYSEEGGIEPYLVRIEHEIQRFAAVQREGQSAYDPKQSQTEKSRSTKCRGGASVSGARFRNGGPTTADIRK